MLIPVTVVFARYPAGVESVTADVSMSPILTIAAPTGAIRSVTITNLLRKRIFTVLVMFSQENTKNVMRIASDLSSVNEITQMMIKLFYSCVKMIQ